jgi:hypothetical protein
LPDRRLAIKARGQDADDRRRHGRDSGGTHLHRPDSNDATEDVGGATETALPVRVSQQRDGWCALAHVVDLNAPAEQRLDAEDLQEILREIADDEALGHPCIYDARNKAGDPAGADVRKDASGLAPGADVGRRGTVQARLPPERFADHDFDELLRVWVWQRPQQGGIDDAEECSRHADPHRQVRIATIECAVLRRSHAIPDVRRTVSMIPPPRTS